MTEQDRIWPYLVILVVCAFSDWALTVDALSMQIATEANPLMRPIMELDPAASLIFKVGLVTASVTVLYMIRAARYTLLATKTVAYISMAVVVYSSVARAFVL